MQNKAGGKALKEILLCNEQVQSMVVLAGEAFRKKS